MGKTEEAQATSSNNDKGKEDVTEEEEPNKRQLSRELSSELLADSPTNLPEIPKKQANVIPHLPLEHFHFSTSLSSKHSGSLATIPRFTKPKKLRTTSSKAVFRSSNTPKCSSSKQVSPTSIKASTEDNAPFDETLKLLDAYIENKDAFKDFTVCKEFKAQVFSLDIHKKNPDITRTFFGISRPNTINIEEAIKIEIIINKLHQNFIKKFDQKKIKKPFISRFLLNQILTRLIDPCIYKQLAIAKFNEFYTDPKLHKITGKIIKILYHIFTENIDKKVKLLKKINSLYKESKSYMFSDFIKLIEKYIKTKTLLMKVTDPNSDPAFLLICIKKFELTNQFEIVPLNQLYPELNYNDVFIKTLYYLSIFFSNEIICKILGIPKLNYLVNFENEPHNVLFTYKHILTRLFSYRDKLDSGMVYLKQYIDESIDASKKKEIVIENCISDIEHFIAQKDKPISSFPDEFRLAIDATLAVAAVPSSDNFKDSMVRSTIDPLHDYTIIFLAYIKTIPKKGLPTNVRISHFIQIYLNVFFPKLEEGTSNELILCIVMLYHYCKNFDFSLSSNEEKKEESIEFFSQFSKKEMVNTNSSPLPDLNWMSERKSSIQIDHFVKGRKSEEDEDNQAIITIIDNETEAIQEYYSFSSM